MIAPAGAGALYFLTRQRPDYQKIAALEEELGMALPQISDSPPRHGSLTGDPVEAYDRDERMRAQCYDRIWAQGLHGMKAAEKTTQGTSFKIDHLPDGRTIVNIPVQYVDPPSGYPE